MYPHRFSLAFASLHVPIIFDFLLSMPMFHYHTPYNFSHMLNTAYLYANYLPNTFQPAHTECHPTETTLPAVHNHFKRLWGNRRSLFSYLLNHSAAFDSVHQSNLFFFIDFLPGLYLVSLIVLFLGLDHTLHLGF
jgi:hypothetical protein